MNRRRLIPLLVAVSGVLIAAGGVPAGYWDSPRATATNPPHAWSELERDLSPEACAQCHGGQFEAWRESMHARAFSPGLIGQFPHMGLSDSNDCLQCHAPLAEQKFSTPTGIDKALQLLLKQPAGFDMEANLEAERLPLRHAGVTCAACHVRNGQRFGPPRRGSGQTGRVEGPAHGGFTGLNAFEQSQFCAGCHQFPQQYAINGKPLENTVAEWRQSRFAREGVQCQACHMPDRKHAFKGIHDMEMVKQGVAFETRITGNEARLTIASTWVGHAFPTYVTPKVVVRIAAENAGGEVIRERFWEISRTVRYENGWREISDTRLLPGERRSFSMVSLPPESRMVRFTVDVIPDHYYKGVYRALLADELTPPARKLIERALYAAGENDYNLFAQSERLR